MIFVNTRPRHRGQPLTEALQSTDYHVVELPLLALSPLNLSQQESQIFSYWQAGEYDLLVVVSPTSAQLGLAYCSQSYTQDCIQGCIQNDVPSLPVIAVGEATAKVLRQSGWQVYCPDEASNEGMLNMPVIEQLQAGSRVLIWRGVGGRRLLIDQLQARGVEVDSIAWYDRQLPQEAFYQYQQLVQAYVEPYLIQGQQGSQNNKSTSAIVGNTTSNTTLHQPYMVVLISSGLSFTHWQMLLTDFQKQACNIPSPKLADYYYMVIGQRLSAQLSAQQLPHVRIDDLDSNTILSALSTLKVSR